MAVVQLESLVLRGVGDACNVAMVLERNGSTQADGRTPMVPLSYPRHLLSSYPHAGTCPGKRPGDAEDLGAATAAKRAGRPGSSGGVSDSRSLAINARRSIQFGWAATERGACTATWRAESFTIPAPAAVGMTLSGRPDTFQRAACRAGGQRAKVGLA
jgi:hypothetical protein